MADGVSSGILSQVTPAKAGIHSTVTPAKASIHSTVIPAKAGIHVTQWSMDPRFRGDDNVADARYAGRTDSRFQT